MRVLSSSQRRFIICTWDNKSFRTGSQIIPWCTYRANLARVEKESQTQRVYRCQPHIPTCQHDAGQSRKGKLARCPIQGMASAGGGCASRVPQNGNKSDSCCDHEIQWHFPCSTRKQTWDILGLIQPLYLVIRRSPRTLNCAEWAKTVVPPVSQSLLLSQKDTGRGLRLVLISKWRRQPRLRYF